MLAIWYYPDEDKYKIQADKEDTSAHYEYYTQTGEFGGEYPDPDSVKAYFSDVYMNLDVGDVYIAGVELFEGYVNDTFGMNVDELYAQAAS